MDNVKIQIVIPARMASTRLPRKLLLSETGKPLIQHTYEAACQTELDCQVCVAVDHPVMEACVEAFGGNAIMTSDELQSGTDRVAAVAQQSNEFDVIINVQGDEPEIPASAIKQVAQLLVDDSRADVATVACPIVSRSLLEDPACVKVVRDASGNAMYFSRSAIPHARAWEDSLLKASPANFLHHLGLYAYRRSFLLGLSEIPPSPLEEIEKLEQLRWLQAGVKIAVGIVNESAKGIDTEDDYAAFVERFRKS